MAKEYTVISESTDGKHHRNLTVMADSPQEARAAAEAQNAAIADQEQSEAYEVKRASAS